jgi:two-component system KDP operon response regulator KdpE
MTAATILVVDDEPQIRRVMLTTLASQGYSVIEARSGEEALEKMRGERPDLILLDVNLPGISTKYRLSTLAPTTTSSNRSA